MSIVKTVVKTVLSTIATQKKSMGIHRELASETFVQQETAVELLRYTITPQLDY